MPKLSPRLVCEMFNEAYQNNSTQGQKSLLLFSHIVLDYISGKEKFEKKSNKRVSSKHQYSESAMKQSRELYDLLCKYKEKNSFEIPETTIQMLEDSSSFRRYLDRFLDGLHKIVSRTEEWTNNSQLLSCLCITIMRATLAAHQRVESEQHKLDWRDKNNFHALNECLKEVSGFSKLR